VSYSKNSDNFNSAKANPCYHIIDHIDGHARDVLQKRV